MNSKLPKQSKIELLEIFACPRCKTSLSVQKNTCPKCKFAYYKKDGIWHFLYIPRVHTKKSQKQYDLSHQEYFYGPTDGSYEILASIARGNKTVDIACGEGIIEQLSPNTVGVEFSLNALKKARSAGVKNLVLANAHNLPFRDNAFDLAICAGSLEQFENPGKAILEMGRVAKIQVLTVHRQLPILFAKIIFNLATKLFKVKHQPIESPIDENTLVKMLEKASLHVVFKGIWTLPVNYGRVIKFLPELTNIPSCSFVISIKKNAKISH